MATTSEDPAVATGNGDSRKRRKAARLKNQPTSVEGTLAQGDNSEGSDCPPVPKAVGMMDYARARLLELQTMAKAVKKLTGTRRVTQALPRHMRRRAASHNSKRLPVRLRAAALREIEKQHNGDKVAKSRRHRRRPGNLMTEFSRRQRRIGWLETHLWHAKRMHMKEKWGYRLAESPCDKGRRAAYRSTSRGCMMVDTSFYTCVELCGSQAEICRVFEPLTSPRCGPTVKAAQFLSGQRHGSMTLFRQGGFPHNALGPVQFLWRPAAAAEAEVQPSAKRVKRSDTGVVRRHLWLWLHPAMLTGAMAELKQTCQTANVSVSSLKDELCRFSLLGPKSLSLLKEVLETFHPSSVPRCDDNDTEWWQKESAWEEAAEQNSLTWQSHNAFPARTVVGLVVRDPRLSLPDKRRGLSSIHASALSETESELLTQDIPACLSASTLWQTSVRKQVKATKQTEQQFNKRRSLQRASPEEGSVELSQSLVPILLCRHSQGHGWDVVLPAGWAMAFWVPLVYHGVRTGGQQELRQYSLEAGRPMFPQDSFDSAAGQVCARQLHVEREEEYLRHPPSKRLSFPQLAVMQPFHLAWKDILCKVNTCPLSGEQSVGAPYILRDATLLRRVQQAISALSSRRVTQRCSANSGTADNGLAAVRDCASMDSSSFIPVCLETTDRGVFTHGATISMPVPEDLRTFNSTKTMSPVQPRLCPKKSSVGVECVSDAKLTVTCSSHEPCRTTIGYVCSGVHSLSRGNSVAVGYCSFTAIVSWLSLLSENKVTRPVVLTRNQSSYQYRAATVRVLVDASV